MLYNQNLERTKQYARTFWEKELIDRPYVCVTSMKNGGKMPEKGVFHTPANCHRAIVSAITCRSCKHLKRS